MSATLSIEMRHNMVLNQLFTNEVTDRNIFQAMVNIPREAFVPEALHGSAYVDEDIDVGNGRYMLAPLTFAKLLDLAELTPSSRVLVIGAHTGYAAAVIAQLSAMVIATDTDATALEHAKLHLNHMQITNVSLQKVASLAEGYEPSGPYDVIFINGAIDYISETLAAQIASAGRLVTIRSVQNRPGTVGGLGKGLLIRRIDQKLQYREYFDAGTPLLPGFKQDESFVF